jgi:hypothetical protein
MPTTGAPWNIYYPDNTAPISPIENLFSTLSTSVATALTLFQTEAPYVVAAPSNLDALTTAAVGAIAYMTAPGTGISAMTWRALSTGSGAGLDWQIEDDVIVADTKAHFDSFVTVIAGLAGVDLQFKIGQLVRIAGDSLYYVITSTAGAYQPLLAFLGQVIAEGMSFPVDLGSSASGTTIDTISFPSLPYATTVYATSYSDAGFNGAAATVALAVTTSAGTLTQPTAQAVQAPSAQFTTVMQMWKLVIPASTAATITIKTSSSATTYWRSATQYKRVTS